MRTIILFAALFFAVTIYGQENTAQRKGLTFKIGTRYLGWTDVSIPNPEDYEEDITFSNDGQYGKSLRIYVGYFASPKLSLNLGFGLDRYEGTSANTSPLVVQSNYYLSPNKNSFFASAEVGTQIAFSENLDKGFVYALMIGKEISFSDKTGLNVYLGYNFQRSKYEHENEHPNLIYRDKLNRKSFILGVDFVIF
ncbi:MAG: hypothetical protein PWR04_1092 [Anaerophaga sp.]|nr:hypothetical protein [Anaerophaga sp.]